MDNGDAKSFEEEEVDLTGQKHLMDTAVGTFNVVC